MSVEPLRIGVLGTGHLYTQTLRPRIELYPGLFRIVAAFGNEPEATAATPQEVVQRDDVDCVWVLSPAQVHYEQCLLALEAGKHVYMQKPLAATSQEVEEIAKLAERKGVSVMVAPGQPLYPTLRLIKDVLVQQELGPIFFCTSALMGWGGQEIHWAISPEWRFQSGNGPLRDHGLYSLATLIYLFGEVRRVTAFQDIAVATRSWNGADFKVTEADRCVAILHFESGAFGSMIEGWCAGGPGTHLRIFGLEKSLTAFGDQFDACPRGFRIHSTFGEEQSVVDGTSHAEIRAYFADGLPNPHVWHDVAHHHQCIRAGETPISNPRSVLNCYRTIDAIEESSRTGRAVNLETARLDPGPVS
jgi:predicted dehydrogenase